MESPKKSEKFPDMPPPQVKPQVCRHLRPLHFSMRQAFDLQRVSEVLIVQPPVLGQKSVVILAGAGHLPYFRAWVWHHHSH
jgi:hypothetical protein